MGAEDNKFKLDKFIEIDESIFTAYRKKESNDGLIPVPAKELDRNVKAIVTVSSMPILNAKSKEGCPNSIPSYSKISVVESITKIDIAYMRLNKWF